MRPFLLGMYYMIILTRDGQTPGKKIMKIRIVRFMGDQTVKTRVTISSACPALAVPEEPGAPVVLDQQPRKALQALQALSAGRLGQ